jgi:hypothetical protein
MRSSFFSLREHISLTSMMGDFFSGRAGSYPVRVKKKR